MLLPMLLLPELEPTLEPELFPAVLGGVDGADDVSVFEPFEVVGTWAETVVAASSEPNIRTVERRIRASCSGELFVQVLKSNATRVCGSMIYGPPSGQCSRLGPRLGRWKVRRAGLAARLEPGGHTFHLFHGPQHVLACDLMEVGLAVAPPQELGKQYGKRGGVLQAGRPEIDAIVIRP